MNAIKSKIPITVTILLSVLCLMLAACNTPYEQSYETEDYTGDGYHYLTDTDTAFSETSEKAATVFDDGVITTADDESEDGVITYPHTVYETAVAESTAILQHTHTFDSSWSHDANGHWHAATCEHTAEKSDFAVHTWDNGAVTSAPTETKDGIKTYTCTVCGETKSEIIPKTEVELPRIGF